MNQITSDTALIDIEHPFKITAGPGAGKTYWLTEHMRYVLHRSKRLGKIRKIACITYTNVAVEAILKRMEISVDRLEVSTIHSFFYKHVVKPYASFIANEFNLNVKKMDGHDDEILSSYSFLDEWKSKTGQKRIQDNIEIVNAIRSARWRFEGEELNFKPDYPMMIKGYPIKNDSYYEYKRMAWERGKVHHDDVLFFSYHLINKYPFILTILRAKFPYFFVDEFQDTNPIQAEIVRLIGQKHTVIGVIGDPAQSIYGFQGADLSRFISFTFPGMVDYSMHENRRSTKTIVNALNCIRKDIEQFSVSEVQGEQPVIVIGEMGRAVSHINAKFPGKNVQALTRDNITSNILKRGVTGVDAIRSLKDELYKSDNPSSSNKYRSLVVISSIEAIELAREGKFKEALVAMEKIFKQESNKDRRRALALDTIRKLLLGYYSYKDGSLMNFCLFVKDNIRSEISSFRAGKAKEFYESHTYQQLAVCVNIVEDKSLNKTIHKAKGDEFDNVLLILKEEKDIQFLLEPDLTSSSNTSEEQRIYYVAISRARKNMAISIPALDSSKKALLSDQFSIDNV
ncbi:MAG: ATP-dependent helicase [Candidatus Thiodiazotropha sp. 6PDIVS]